MVDYLVDAYAHGYTPNPDVMCNQTVKFGTFLERALAAGADYVATGHYGRVARGDDGRVRLLRALDEHKDQTYFLWRVGEAALARTLLPVGEIRDKAEVRRMCAERGLGVENKPDSDGICFVGPGGHPDVPARHAGSPRGVMWWSGRPVACSAVTTAPSSSQWGSGAALTWAVARPATSWTRTSRRTWCT